MIQPTRSYGRHLVRLLSALLLVAAQAGAATDASFELLPETGKLSGWAYLEEPISYSQDSLWVYINGAAEQYIGFGCTSVLVAYCGREDSEDEITLEIYRMEDDLGAFGLYMLERPPMDSYLDLGTEGYRQGANLSFFGGPYYLKLQVYPVEEEQLEAMHEIAKIIADEHFAESAMPADLELFPKADLVPGSFELTPRAVLGMRGLSRALSANYQRDDQVMTLYLARERDVESATTAESTFRESLEKRGTKPVESVTIAGVEGVRAELKYHGAVLMLMSEENIVLIKGVDDPDWVDSVISELLKNLAAQD